MSTRTGVRQNLNTAVQKLLIFIGRPFFLLVLAATNASLFLLYFIGKTLLLLISAVVKSAVLLTQATTKLKKALAQSLNLASAYLTRLSTKLKSSLPTVKKPLPKISLPRLPHLRLPPFTFLRLPVQLLTQFGPWRKRKPGRPRKSRLRQKLVPIISLFASLSLIFIFGLYLPFLKNLPNPNILVTRNQPLTTKILARDGTVLFKIFKDQNRTLVPLADIPQSLKLATIAIEDKNFYTHPGFSYRGIVRALRRNVLDHQTQGGSTITQQLVKNALLSPEKTLARKVREIILSVLVEIKFDKDEILEMYFNEVAYGGPAYGAEEASQTYFGKSVKNLSLSEASLLAGLPAAPTTYSPFGTHPELAKSRQAEVLRRMHEDGFITADQAETAKTQPLHFTLKRTDITAPHFVMYVRDLLVKKYGEQKVLQGGLEVTTSLDLVIQTAAEDAVRQEIDQLGQLHVTNGAALVTKPHSGEILAMVGSKDYFDFEVDGQVNVTLRPRQPGSSIKPVNYAVALENGFTPATIIPDSPICYRLPAQKPYCPRNYDNAFHGNVTLRNALANSYNVPAVKTLSINGVTKMIEQGQKMGITTWDEPSRFGLSLTLGGGEVKMIDMAVVYGTLANQGLRVDLHPILKVKDSHGKTLEEFECQTGLARAISQNPTSFPNPAAAKSDLAQAVGNNCPSQQVLNPSVAYQLTSILSDSIARIPAFGTNSVLTVPNHQVAVKTGTTQNLRDNWTIGYTSDFVVLSWVGNNDNSPMSYVASGITGASPIWRRITDILLQDKPQHTFPAPQELIKVSVCTLTGQLACPGCPSKEEYFLPGTEPQRACSPEQIKTLKQKQKEEKEKRDQILTGASTEQ